jgi:hypothetical protein
MAYVFSAPRLLAMSSGIDSTAEPYIAEIGVANDDELASSTFPPRSSAASGLNQIRPETGAWSVRQGVPESFRTSGTCM